MILLSWKGARSLARIESVICKSAQICICSVVGTKNCKMIPFGVETVV